MATEPILYQIDPEFDSLRTMLGEAFNRLGIGGYWGDDPYGLAEELLPYFVPVEPCVHGRIDAHWGPHYVADATSNHDREYREWCRGAMPGGV